MWRAIVLVGGPGDGKRFELPPFTSHRIDRRQPLDYMTADLARYAYRFEDPPPFWDERAHFTPALAQADGAG